VATIFYLFYLSNPAIIFSIHNIKKRQMSILSILITLIVCGVILWAINEYIPMDGKIKKLVNIVAIISLIVWLVRVSGILNYLNF
jgi:predicted membrane protein